MNRRFVFGGVGGIVLGALAIGLHTGCPVQRDAVLGVELVADGFESPTFVTSLPDDASRLLVLEQYTGTITLVHDGAKQEQPFLNIDDKVIDSGTERGLFSLAFHPNYESNGRFYVCYSNNGGATVVEEYLVSDEDPNVADPESGEVILTVPQPRPNHNGGMIAFSPVDNMLYVGLGDGGGANDIDNNAQDLTTVLGKMLRLDVDAADLVPADNPFVDDEENPNADPLIWASGLRNPWRFSFDVNNGRLYIGDVGQGAREEIDVQNSDSDGGENYGWRVTEGFACRGGVGQCGREEPFTPPVVDYPRTLGRSVTGGYVYRGSALPDFRGVYFFADFETSRIWTFRYFASGIQELVQRTADFPGFNGIASFGQDADGELYIVDYGDGEIFRVIPAPEEEG